MVGRADASHEAAINEASATLRNAGFKVNPELIPGSVTKIISQKLETLDLLVMGAYGHSQIREFFVGTTTTKLVRSSKAPVLMFR